MGVAGALRLRPANIALRAANVDAPRGARLLDQRIRRDHPTVAPEPGPSHDAGVLRAASDHADLAFHALAFVPPRVDAPELVRATSLHRPAWIHLATERLPPEAVMPIAHDAPLVGALTTTAEIAIALQRLACLHDTIGSFLATVRRAVADLGAADVARPADLAEIQAVPAAPIEILRAALALSARAFEAAHVQVLRPFAGEVLAALTPRWEALVAQLPSLATLDLHVSATLGPRGRLVNDTALVGTTTMPWDGGPPDTATPLALAAHEASVRAAGAVLRGRAIPAPWSLIERIALDGAALAYPGTVVEEPYAVWRLRLHEGGLAPASAATETLASEVRRRLRG